MNNFLKDVILYLNKNDSTESIKINGARRLSYSDGYYSMLISTHYNQGEKFDPIFKATNPPISGLSIENRDYKFVKIIKLEEADILYELIYTDAK